jgi:hypothetical protein
MSRKLAALLTSFALFASPQPGQTAKTGKTITPAHVSKAQAWAEAVTNFVADPNVGGSFRQADSAGRFRSLIPAGSMDVDGHLGFGKNPAAAIIALEYSTEGVERAPTGISRISWVNIYMPRTDPDGADLISRVAALMKRKLPKPWRYYVMSKGQSYYWEQRQTLSVVNVDLAASFPAKDRTPNEGPWVVVHFGREQSAGESDE